MKTKKNQDIYRITLINNLKALIEFGFWAITIIVTSMYFSQREEYFTYKTVLLILAVTFPFWGTTIFVHLEYLRLNWRAEFKVDKNNKAIFYSDKKNNIEADFNEIMQIEKHRTKKTGPMGEAYFYHKIFLKEREPIIITSLLARDFSITGFEIEEKIRFIPSIYFE